MKIPSIFRPTDLASVVRSMTAALILVGQIPSATSADAPPNVLLIIADDLGYGETGMMGNPQIPTPAIDTLAASGVRCLSGYVTSSYCAPSRAAIMSGCHGARLGFDHNPVGPQNLLPSAGLSPKVRTIAETLGDAGFACGLFGKWHLGTTEGRTPPAQGFESFFGFLHEGHFYVPGPPHRGVWSMLRDRSLPRGERIRLQQTFRGNYASISEPAYDQENPLFLSSGTQLQPIEVTDYLTDAITDRAVRFIDAAGEQPFFACVAYNAVHSPMQATAADYELFAHIEDPQRRIFAGMLSALDRGVGRLLQTLLEHNLRERTLVIFISDNGGPTAELTSSNAPLRGGKGTLYEGGVRVPFVWSWPGRLPQGVTEPRAVLSADIAATIADATETDDSSYLDGVSLMTRLGRDEDALLHEQLYWRMPGGKAAIRSGDWKLVKSGVDAPVELFDLSSDGSEAHDLSAARPDVCEQLLTDWRQWDERMGKMRSFP